MRKFSLLWLTIFFINGSHFLFAQSAWTVFDMGNSLLPNNMVRSIAIDSLGRKWVATDNGLAVVADTGWSIYTVLNGLPDNAVKCVAVEKNGIVWAGTGSGGVAKFDGTSWTSFNSSNSGLTTDYVQAIAFDTAGNKWIGTQAGLFFYNDTTWRIYSVSNSVLFSDNIKAIAVDDSNYVYIGTLNGGFVTIKDTVMTLYALWNSTVPDNTILSLAIDSSGRRWMACPANGLAYNIANYFYVYNPGNSLIQSSSFYSVAVDSLQQVYAGSFGAGLIKKTGLFFEQYSTLNSGIPDDYILSIAIERNGIIWLGTTAHGLVKLDESLLTGLNEVGDPFSIHVFPNPAMDKLIVTGLNEKVRKIELLNSRGEIGITLNNLKGHKDMPVDLSDCSAGIYFLRIIRDDRVMIKKIVKVN